jgi:hypothetical protein
LLKLLPVFDKIVITTLVYEKIAIFFAENWQKIAEISDYNIDPRSCGVARHENHCSCTKGTLNISDAGFLTVANGKDSQASSFGGKISINFFEPAANRLMGRISMLAIVS